MGKCKKFYGTLEIELCSTSRTSLVCSPQCKKWKWCASGNVNHFVSTVVCVGCYCFTMFDRHENMSVSSVKALVWYWSDNYAWKTGAYDYEHLVLPEVWTAKSFTEHCDCAAVGLAMPPSTTKKYLALESDMVQRVLCWRTYGPAWLLPSQKENWWYWKVTKAYFQTMRTWWRWRRVI